MPVGTRIRQRINGCSIPPVPILGEMNPPPLRNNYGDLTSLSGLPGQGTPSANAVEKQFTAILSLSMETNYYDPSYGGYLYG